MRLSEKEEGVSERHLVARARRASTAATAAGGDAAADTVAAPEEPPAARFGKDDMVIVTYKGHAHPAKVRRVRADTYDVEYDDGEKEKHVALTSSRRPRPSSSPRSCARGCLKPRAAIRP